MPSGTPTRIAVVIARYARPAMSRVWSEEAKLEHWLAVELAVLDAWATSDRSRRRPLAASVSARALRPRRASPSSSARRITTSRLSSTRSSADLGPDGALVPLRPDLVRRPRYRARADGPERRHARSATGSTARSTAIRRARGGAPRDRDDRADARRPRRADDVRAQAPRLGIPARARPEPARPRAGRDARRASSPAPSGRMRRRRRRSSGSRARRSGSSRPRPRRRSSSATGTRSSSRRSRSSHRRSTASRSRSATSRARRCARSRSRSREGQKGSSAMPHKRNPIVAERICGLARLVRGYALVGLENVALWHERDISHSSAERVVLPDAFLAVDYMLDRFAWLVEGLVVRPERMRANLEATGGLFFSQRLLLALVESGLERDEAYRMVQRHAMRAWDEGLDFRGPRPIGSADRGAGRSRRGLRPRFVHEACRRRLRARARASCSAGGECVSMEATHVGSGKVRELYALRGRDARAHRERSHLDVRRRPADADPGQGASAHRALGVLVRADARARPEPPAPPRRRRSHDDLPPARDASDRVRRARIPRRLRVEGLPRRRAPSAATCSPAASRSRRGCPSRSSLRRRRRSRATTRTSTRSERPPSAERIATTPRRRRRSRSTASRSEHAEARGIILADTKFEFGVAPDGIRRAR